MSDEQLFLMIKEGKLKARQAFEEIYSRYSTKIFTYCNRILFDKELAEDVFQETFLRFYETAEKNREMSNVSAFLFKIARNLCINEKQRKHHSFITFEELIYPTKDQNFERKEKEELMQMALDALPKKFREVLVLKEYLGFSYKEISEILETTLPSVRIRIYRAKQRIREILTPYLEDLHED